VSPGLFWTLEYTPGSRSVVSGLSRSRRRNLHNRLADAADRIEEEPWSSPKGIEEDRRDADRDRHHRPDRVDQAGGRNRNADSIEKEGKRDVLHHLAVAPAADFARSCQRIQSIRQDDDVRRFDGDVGPPAHGDPYVRLHQRRSIVDTIADHRDAAVGLKLSHESSL